MENIGKAKTEIKKPKSKAFVSEAWLKEDNIGKEGFIISHKNLKVRFND